MLWQVLDIIQIHQHLAEITDREGLRKDAIHAVVHRAEHELFLDMAGDGDDLGLEFALQAIRLPEIPDLPRCLIPIHERHVTIHQY